MTEKHVFADVDLPFHVWVKEGTRWVLRDAAAQMKQLKETSAQGAPSAGASRAATGAGGSR